MKLQAQYVEKPWGRLRLPPIFQPTDGRRVGELWFVTDIELPLLAKYLFTSERLSVQVHPNDEQAAQRGLSRGKCECWYIVDADPGAVIGLGLRREVDHEELRCAALDGSIIDLMDWRPVATGDFLLVPPGTIHAIGGGISLMEFQQNSDVTYRLYDYGRPRELHLEDGVAVAQPAPYPEDLIRHVSRDDAVVLTDSQHFRLVHGHSDAMLDQQRWVLPLEGRVRCGDDIAGAGECLLLQPGDRLEVKQARLLVGAAS